MASFEVEATSDCMPKTLPRQDPRSCRGTGVCGHDDMMLSEFVVEGIVIETQRIGSRERMSHEQKPGKALSAVSRTTHMIVMEATLCEVL